MHSQRERDTSWQIVPTDPQMKHIERKANTKIIVDYTSVSLGVRTAQEAQGAGEHLHGLEWWSREAR